MLTKDNDDLQGFRDHGAREGRIQIHFRIIMFDFRRYFKFTDNNLASWGRVGVCKGGIV